MKEKAKYLYIAFIQLGIVLGFGALKFGKAITYLIENGERMSMNANLFYGYVGLVILSIILLFYFLGKYDKENEK